MALTLPWQERVAQLPRDARDTLFNLAVIGWAIAPHLLHLAPWCSVLTVLLLLWRAQLALAGRGLPSRWMVGGLLVLASALTLWTEHSLLGKEAGVTMLVVLMALKTLELRARRDALVVFFLGFFLVLTHFLYSQSLGTGLWLLLAVWGLLASLALANMPVGRPPLVRAASVAARAAALGVPLLVVLFVFFPRIGPLWGLPQDAGASTGLSGSMHLGGLANVAEDDSVALRLRFFGTPPRPDQLYFRGPVLSQFDGREWTRLVPSVPVQDRPRLELSLQGRPLRYEMTLEPSRTTLLPLLEMTPDRADSAPQLPGLLLIQRPDGQWQADRLLSERVRLQATAWLDFRQGPRAPVSGLGDLLALPPQSNPRTQAWARALRAQPELAHADASTLAAAVLQYIRSGGYTYTLEAGSYGEQAIDEFWLDRKRGFCEHFASAFVVIMRAMDVPARIVTGYQGTDPNPVDGWWIVRQRNAHAWAEIWQPGQGWLRVDPTAAVDPARVQRGQRLEPPRGLVAGTLNRMAPALLGDVRNALELVNNRWNQWVLNYSRGQQFDLLRELGFEAPSWQDLATTLILLLCSAALAGAVWAWWDRRRQDPWQRLQQRVQRRLGELGVTVQPHDPPRRRAERTRATLGPRGEALAASLEALDHARYAVAGRPDAAGERAWWRRFARTARAMGRIAPAGGGS
jgi:transglutaminase-like putative cysteine protease